MLRVRSPVGEMEDTSSCPHFPKLFLDNTIGSTLGDMENNTQILRHVVAFWPWLTSAWDTDGLRDTACLLYRRTDKVLWDRQDKGWGAGQGSDLEE